MTSTTCCLPTGSSRQFTRRTMSRALDELPDPPTLLLGTPSALKDSMNITECTATVYGQSGPYHVGIEYSTDADGTHHEIRRPLLREQFLGYGLSSEDTGLAIMRISHDGAMTEWRTDYRREGLAPCERPYNVPLLNLPDGTWGESIDIPSTNPPTYFVCDREITHEEAERRLAAYAARELK